jgi:hypothetical protein
MRIACVLAVVCGVSVSAHAEQLAPQPDRDPLVLLGVNQPILWHTGILAASAYVRVASHLAVRANAARYDGAESPLDFINNLRRGGGYGRAGRTFDLGIAGVWYPRRVGEGPMLELGALRRKRNIDVRTDTGETITTRSMEYAGRVMVGWTWRSQHLFLAVAAGLSVGREDGKDTLTSDHSGATMTTPVRRQQVDGETYLRVGWVFGG